MRIRYLPAAVTITLMVLLTSCSSSDTTSSLEVPDMPNASASNEVAENETPSTVPTNPDATPPPGEEAPYVNPLTGETSTGSTEQGVQDFTAKDNESSLSDNAAITQLLDDAGIENNKQATRAVGEFTSADVQDAYNTLTGFITTGARATAITSPGPNGFTSEEQLRNAMSSALGVWMSESALQSVITKSVDLTRVPIVERTNSQQSFYALFPTALCQKDNTSCILATGTQYSKPTITSWTSASGLTGIEFTNQQYYVAIVPAYSDTEETELQRLSITYTLTAQLLPGPAGGWQIVGITASNVAFNSLENMGPVS